VSQDPVSPATSVAKTLTISGGADLEAINAQITLTAIARDEKGVVMAGVQVAWSSDQSSIAAVNPTTGAVTAVTNGTATIRAAAGDAAASTSITVAQRPTQITRVGGDAQRAVVGAQLPTDVSVRALDSLGTHVAGAAVTFAVVEGGGSLNRTSSTSDATGLASARWTLGTSSSSTHRVRALLQLRPQATVDFTATATPDVPTALTKVSGDHQSAPQSTALPLPIVVVVADRFNNPVAGVDLDFIPNAGSGSVSPTGAATNATGQARTTWTIGTAVPASTTQTLLVRGRTVSLPSVAFSATAAKVQTDSSAGVRPH
jgi:hypothetical protein